MKKKNVRNKVSSFANHANNLKNWKNVTIKNHRDKREKSSPKVTIQGNYTRVKISSSMLKLSSIYSVNNKWIKIIIITVVSIISGIIGDLLLQNTGLYTVGIEAIAQGIARLSSFFASEQTKEIIMNALFWSLIIVVNIPLLIFGWFKVGKAFTLYSSFYVVVSSIFGLAFGFINGIHDVFIFADTNLNPNGEASFLAHDGVQITLWNYDTTSQLSLFVYGFVYGVIQAIFYAILFILGCSSAGLDMIIVWYAEKKYKDLGTVFTYFNILSFILSYIIGTYIPASISISNHLSDAEKNFHTEPWEASLFFSPNFVSTLVMSVVLGTTLNKFFPKYQMCKVEILSKNVDEIRNEIIESQKPYSLSISTVEGGYSKLPQKSLVTNCMYIDAPNLLKLVRKHDANALFILTIIKNIDGFMYVASKEEDDIKFDLLSRRFKKFKKNKKDVKILFEINEENNENNSSTIKSNDVNIVSSSSDNNKTLEQEMKVIQASEVLSDHDLENLDD